jgi:hypothetical protein
MRVFTLRNSVAEPHHVDAAPDPAQSPGMHNDAAPAPQPCFEISVAFARNLTWPCVPEGKGSPYDFMVGQSADEWQYGRQYTRGLSTIVKDTHSI